MCDSSLDCDRLQPAQHLLKSLSGVGAEFQCCDWLSGRRNDVIHSEQRLYLYKTHSARHVPGEGRQEKLKLENAQWGEYILCSTCWSWLMEGLICHLLLKRMSTETLCRGSAESTDSSWIQEEDTWAMLAESTINCETAHRNIQSDNFNLFISAKLCTYMRYVHKELTMTEEQSLKYFDHIGPMQPPSSLNVNFFFFFNVRSVRLVPTCGGLKRSEALHRLQFNF